MRDFLLCEKLKKIKKIKRGEKRGKKHQAGSVVMQPFRGTQAQKLPGKRVLFLLSTRLKVN